MVQRTPWRPPSFPGLSKPTTPRLLPLQQLQRPPSEEVERVAVVLLGTRLGRRVLVPHQRSLLDEVAQGVMVTLGADIAYI